MSRGGERGGRRLGGRYRLQHKVGSGGLADVYAAWDERLRRRVAVKLFRAANRPDDRRRFTDEVALLAALDHPHLVRLLDAGTDDDHPWAVMPLLTGGTLDRAVSPQQLPKLYLAVADVATALAYIHARGIVHRDVKPSNVLLDGNGRAHLADFGVARMLSSAALTLTGTTVGTPAYLAPEQVSGGEVTDRADVYSLGLVLLEGITGHREYPGGSAEAALARVSRPPRIPADLDPAIADVIAAMTATHPRARPSADQVAHRLWEIIGPDVTPGTARTLPEVLPRARYLRWALPAAVAVVAVAAAGAVTLRGEDQDPGAPGHVVPAAATPSAGGATPRPPARPATTGARSTSPTASESGARTVRLPDVSTGVTGTLPPGVSSTTAAPTAGPGETVAGTTRTTGPARTTAVTSAPVFTTTTSTTTIGSTRTRTKTKTKDSNRPTGERG